MGLKSFGIRPKPARGSQGPSNPLSFQEISELGMAKASQDSGDEITNIVVLRADDRQFGLVVDRINDGCNLSGAREVGVF